MTRLKVSLAQQLEEVDRVLKELRNNKPRIGGADINYFISRMEAVRRSLTFIAEHKDTFLKLVEQEGMEGGLRSVD